MIAIDVTSPVPSAIETTIDTAYTLTLRRGACQQKQRRCHRAQLRAEPSLNQLIGRIELAAKILRQEHKADDDATDYISHDHLQKSQIGIVGEAGNADDGQRARLRRDNRQGNCPPGNIAIGEEIVTHRPLAFAEAQAKQRYPGQVRGDNQQVNAI